MRNSSKCFWLPGGWGLNLAIATLGSVLASPSLAQDSREIQIHLQAGEAREVLVDLGRDSRPDLDFLAQLTQADGKAWPEGLALTLADTTDRQTGEHKISKGPGSRQVRLLAAARHCTPPGRYKARLQITALDKAADIPLGIIVESDSCAAVKARAEGAALLIALAGVYVRVMFFSSTFLSPSLLAQHLQPLFWTENRDVVGGGRREDLQNLVVRQLSLGRRALAWLAANPLIFGLPWTRYEEAVHIDLGRRPDSLVLTPVSKRQAFEYFRSHPDEAKGRLFATAQKGSSLLFFALPDSRGRIGKLQPREPLRSDQVLPLSRIVHLLEPEPPADLVNRPAGWKVLGFGGGR
ncbi:MAG TPA: hypothetical protein VLB76_19390 [Thermoanaerobaculia bacterium]|jgi:hypothetical protein|nr:hypothetical protein [Thermoanaerobaculia bacterium]